MAESAILTSAKLALRVTGTTFDDEIQGLIDACKSDLEESGIQKILDTDYLTKMAILVYCKANFGYDNPDAAKLTESYEKIRFRLSMASDYNAFKVTFIVTRSAVAVKGAYIEIYDSEGTLTETLITNSKGVAIYINSEKDIDLDYIVSYDGTTVTGSVYVDADESVAVSI